MQNPVEDFYTFIYKFSGFICAIAAGVITKISYEMLMKRKLSIFQWIGIVGISIFFGYLSSVYCMNNALEKQSGWIVPICTLFGEKIMIYLTTHYRGIIDKIMSPKK
jgi:hypothetical protein